MERKNNSIFATATATNKPENQDCKDTITKDLFNAVLVADGLGSKKYALQSSTSVVSTLKKQLDEIEDIGCLNFENFFKTAKEELIKMSERIKTEDEKLFNNLFGTTLIALVETEKTVKVAYVGNGAIWHIRGNFDDQFHTEFFTEYSPLSITWGAVNLLNPHSIFEKGKEALYRLITEDSSDFNECIPTVIEIEKDCQQGDIFMICSDGVYSADHLKSKLKPSKINSGEIFLPYERKMRIFFEHLKCFFELQEYSNETLNDALNKYLTEIKPDLDDDATISVLVTKTALTFQKQKREKTIENNTDN
jgi:serine/threonine protein phosphatase PrpC